MRVSLLVFSGLILLTACRQVSGNKVSAPIVLGDSATIVTETDSLYLQSTFTDFEVDMQSQKDTVEKPTSAVTPVADTVAVAASTPAATAPSGPGLKADFGTVQVFIENLRVRNAARNVKNANSIAYSSDGSAFSGKNMLVTGAKTVSSIRQKTDYRLELNTGKEMLPLPLLGTQSTGWQNLSGSDGKYSIATAQVPEFKLSNATIKKAVQEAARKAKMPRADETALLGTLRNVKTVDGDFINARPAVLQWQVSGKDAAGKAFTKDIRIDF